MEPPESPRPRAAARANAAREMRDRGRGWRSPPAAPAPATSERKPCAAARDAVEAASRWSRRGPGVHWRVALGLPVESTARRCERWATAGVSPGSVRASRAATAGAVVDAGIRCFYCAHCSRFVRLCSRCDRGQVTCGAQCRALRRRAFVRAAGRRYQRTRRGRRLHAARQHRWRERAAKKVTHPRSTRAREAPSFPPRARTPVRAGQEIRPEAQPARALASPLRCDRCGRACAPLVRRRWRSFGPLRRSEEERA